MVLSLTQFFLKWNKYILVYTYMCACVCVYQPLHTEKIWHKVNSNWSFIGWIQSFPFHRLVAIPKVKEPNLPCYLLFAWRRIIRFILFSSITVLCGMQSAASRIGTCVTVSISYYYNHYTMEYIYIYISIHKVNNSW